MGGLLPYALSTADQIKQYLDAAADGSDDPLFEGLINSFSTYAQGFCNRQFLLTQYAENFTGPLKKIWLSNPPINYDPEQPDQFQVWYDHTRQFTDPKYRLRFDHDFDTSFDAGIIYPRHEHLLLGQPKAPHAIRVIYPGGIFSDQTQENPAVPVPADLRSACEMQVIFWYKQRDNYGLTSTSGQIGTTAFFSPTNILPFVDTVLQSYYRFPYQARPSHHGH